MALDITVYLMCNKFGLQCFCFLKQGPKFCYRIDFWSMTTIQIILSFCTLTSSQFCWFKVGNVLSFYNHDNIFRLYTKKDRLLFGYLLFSVNRCRLLCYLSYNIYHWSYQVRIWILWIYLWAGMAKYFINRRKTPHVSGMIKPFPWSLLLMLSDNHMALFLFQLKRCTGVLLSYLLGEWICIYAKL